MFYTIDSIIYVISRDDFRRLWDQQFREQSEYFKMNTV